MIPTIKEFFIEHPDVASQWSEHNDNNMLNLLCNSSRKALWVCNVYHCEYEKPIRDKILHPEKCSVCTGSTVFQGYNDLLTVFPDIAAEWDEEKNDISPREIKFSSGKSFWWKCEHGHSWKTRISHRTSGKSGCPQCARDLKSKKQKLQSLEKYGAVTNHEIMAKFFISSPDGEIPATNSALKCTWKCHCGYYWEQSPRYFTGCPRCEGKVNNVGNKIYTYHGTIADMEKMSQLFSYDNKVSASDYSQSSAQSFLWECSHGHTWRATAYSIKRSINQGTEGCPYCVTTVSKQEKELYYYIQSIIGDNVQVIQSDHTVISPYELDIYIPEKNIAFEYNGLLWHDESHTGNDKYYHYRKWKMCKEQGIQLITIWEDNWLNNKPVVKSMISHKLGLSTSNHMYARNTYIATVPRDEAYKLCNQHHIQGATAGSVYYGLYSKEDNKLCAVSTWRRMENILYLERYATSCVVVGGLGKLLQAGIQYAQDNKLQHIVTFSDHAVSNGRLYETLGFTYDGELPPDYSYVVNKKRVHKFNYRKNRFRDDPTLYYEDNLTERQLADVNMLPRIYDCGKTRWVIVVNTVDHIEGT